MNTKKDKGRLPGFLVIKLILFLSYTSCMDVQDTGNRNSDLSEKGWLIKSSTYEFKYVDDGDTLSHFVLIDFGDSVIKKGDEPFFSISVQSDKFGYLIKDKFLRFDSDYIYISTIHENPSFFSDKVRVKEDTLVDCSQEVKLFALRNAFDEPLWNCKSRFEESGQVIFLTLYNSLESYSPGFTLEIDTARGVVGIDLPFIDVDDVLL